MAMMNKSQRSALVLGLFLSLAAFFAWGAARFAETGGGRGMAVAFAVLAVGSAVVGLDWARRQFLSRARR